MTDFSQPFVGANDVQYDPKISGLIALRLNPGKSLTSDNGGFRTRVVCPHDATIDAWPIVVVRSFEYAALVRDGIGEVVAETGYVNPVSHGIGSVSLFQSRNRAGFV